MKRLHIISAILIIATANAMAQSILIERSLTKIENASAVVQYNNYFGNLNNPELDEPFPFVVIRMDLLGDETAVRIAKERFQLYLGTMLRVDQIVRSEQNRIIFLLPKGVKNIELLCGDGCLPQTLWSGSLHTNAVYTCQVRYTTASSSSNQDVSAALASINAKLALLENTNQHTKDKNQAKTIKKTEDKHLDKFYQDNSPEACKQRYASGKKCQKAGWALFGTGLAVLGGGIAMLALPTNTEIWKSWTPYGDADHVVYYQIKDGNYDYTYDVSTKTYYTYYNNTLLHQSGTCPVPSPEEKSLRSAGYALLGIGGAATIASVPLLCVGYIRCKNATPLQVNLTAGRQTLGLAMTF